MPEEYKLEGKKFAVKSPTDDGLLIVRETWPEAVAEASVGHWTYFEHELRGSPEGSYGETVGEAWPLHRLGGWGLRVKDRE